MSFELKLDDAQWQRLADLGAQFPQVVGPIFERLINTIAETDGKSYLDENLPHGATDRLATSTAIQFTGAGLNKGARIHPQVAYAGFVEFGRAPGNLPPAEPIIEWARRKGMNRRAAFAIRRAIAQRGTRRYQTKEKGEWQRAFEQIETRLPSRLETAVNQSTEALAGFINAG